MIDLTAKLAPDGTLTWDVPEGQWTILRTGCTLNGTRTQCGAPGNDGWDADPLRAAAIENHFKNTTEILLATSALWPARPSAPCRSTVGKSTSRTGRRRFSNDFRRYRGYDAEPYLAALSGNIVGSAEITDRFLHDYRKTLADCVAENYFGRFTALAHAGKLPEPERGRRAVLSQDDAAGQPEEPRPLRYSDGRVLAGRRGWGENGPIINGKQTASAAHLYGKRLAAAEAFTSFLQWMDSPASLKPTADRAFCEGFNWLFIFSTATQTGDGTPGNEFHAGTHFNRKITWWNQAKSFTDYLARCSYLLQQGLFVADVLLLQRRRGPEPRRAETRRSVARARLRLRRVQRRSPADANGRPRRPHRPARRHELSPAGLARAKRHAGRSPPEDSRSRRGRRDGRRAKAGKRHRLKNYPTVRSRRSSGWPTNCGALATARPSPNIAFGKGRVIWGKKLRDILAADRRSARLRVRRRRRRHFDRLHPSQRGRRGDLFPRQPQRPRGIGRPARSASTAKLPEFWDPVTGAMRNADSYTIADGRTTVPLRLAPYGSVFVVFRAPASATHDRGQELRDAQAGSGTGRPLDGRIRSEMGRAGVGPIRPARFLADAPGGRHQVLLGNGRLSQDLRPRRAVACDRASESTSISARSATLPKSASTARISASLWTAPWRIDITDAVKPRATAWKSP